MLDFKDSLVDVVANGQSEVFDFSSEDFVNSLDIALNVIASSGTLPTLDIVVEASFDKITWFNTGVSFTQAGAVTKELLNVAKTGAFIRFNFTLGGTATPTFSFDIHAVVKG